MEGSRPGIRLDSDLRRRGGVTAASWAEALQPRGWWFPLAPQDDSSPAAAVRELRSAVATLTRSERRLVEAAAPWGAASLDLPLRVRVVLAGSACGSALAAGDWFGPEVGAWVFVAWTTGVPVVVLSALGVALLRRRAAHRVCVAAHAAAVESAHRALDEVLRQPFVVCLPDGVAWCDPGESARRARVAAGRSRGAPDAEAEADDAAWDRAFARTLAGAARSGRGAWVEVRAEDRVTLATGPRASSDPCSADGSGVDGPPRDDVGLEGVEPIPYDP